MNAITILKNQIITSTITGQRGIVRGIWTNFAGQTVVNVRVNGMMQSWNAADAEICLPVIARKLNGEQVVVEIIRFDSNGKDFRCEWRGIEVDLPLGAIVQTLTMKASA